MISPRSLRLLFATIGSRGDVQPVIVLAQEALRRGHRPLVAAPGNFEGWVRESGLEFIACGMDVQQYLAENGDKLSGGALATARETRRIMAEQTPLNMRQLCAAVKGCDGVVWAGVAFVAASVAEWARVPALGIFYTNQLLPSRNHPPALIPWDVPQWLNPPLWSAYNAFAERAFGSLLTPERDALGLPRVPALQHIRRDQHIVIAADPELLPHEAAWGERIHRANFIFHDDPRPLDPELLRWLDDGEAPIYAGFGSMNGSGPRRAAQAFIEAFAASGRRCLIGAGWAGLGGSALPPGWRVVGDAPHARLFPRMAAVIHHGGSGTMASALRAGVPQVVLPLILDQFHHGRMLARAGLAPRPVPMEKITAPVLARMLAEAEALPAAPRQAAARRLQASNAAAAILDRMEAMCA